jgi:hypothetical protein
MPKITSREASALLWGLRTNHFNQIFTVSFVRRTTSKDGLRKAGDVETMQARFGVRKHLKGGFLGYNPVEKEVIILYKVGTTAEGAEKTGYRAIPTDSIVSVKALGEEYEVVQG